MINMYDKMVLLSLLIPVLRATVYLTVSIYMHFFLNSSAVLTLKAKLDSQFYFSAIMKIPSPLLSQ